MTFKNTTEAAAAVVSWFFVKKKKNADGTKALSSSTFQSIAAAAVSLNSQSDLPSFPLTC